MKGDTTTTTTTTTTTATTSTIKETTSDDVKMDVIQNKDRTTQLSSKEYSEILQYVEGYDPCNSDDDDDKKNKKKQKKKEHTKVEHDTGTESKVSSHKVDGTNRSGGTTTTTTKVSSSSSAAAAMAVTESSAKNGQAPTNIDISTPIPSPPELQRINQESLIRTTTPGAVSVVPASQYRYSNNDERTATTDNIQDDSVRVDGDDDDVEQQQSRSPYVNEEPIVATLVETKQDLSTNHDGEEDRQEPEQFMAVAKAVVLPESKSSWKFRALLCCAIFLLLALLVVVLFVTVIDPDRDGDVDVGKQLAPIQADFVSVSNETTTNTSVSYDYHDDYEVDDDDDDEPLAPNQTEFGSVSNETTTYPTASDDDHEVDEVDNDN
jgi:hypothetical protein